MLSQYFRDRKLSDYSLILETSLDCYLRTHEWVHIRREDILDDGVYVALLLGNPERGERVKTGVFQGVVIDAPHLRCAWRKLKSGLKPNELAIKISPDEFMRAWETAKKDLDLKWIGNQHNLRHAGAARDVELNTRTLEQVRRRGRWRAMDSVARYTKTWLLVRARERMSKNDLARGRAIIDALPPRDVAG